MRKVRRRPLKRIARWFVQLHWFKKTLLVGFILLAIIASLAVFHKPFRFAMFNLVITANVQMTVLDGQTGIPVGDVVVTIDGQEVKTNSDGYFYASGVRFGNIEVSLNKQAYKPISFIVEVDRRYNDEEPAYLSPTGKQVVFTARDKLSDEAVKGFKIDLKGTEIIESSSSDGQLVLTIPGTIAEAAKIEVSSDNYMGFTTKINANEKSQVVLNMVPKGRHNFLSNRDGVIDVYSARLDGSKQRLVVPATGAEDRRSELYTSPDGKFGVLVAARNGDSNGTILLRELYVINYQDSSIRQVDAGPIEWEVLDVNNERVLYWTTLGEVENSDNELIKSFNFKTAESKTLFNSKDITQPTYINGAVIFAENIVRLTDPYGFLSRQFIVVDEQDGSRKVLFTDHDTYIEGLISPTTVEYRVFNEASDSFDSYQYNVTTRENTRLSEGSGLKVYDYLVSPDRAQSAWVEQRDGVGTVLVGDIEAEAGKPIKTNLPVTSVIRWFNKDNLLVAVVNSDESSHYVLNIKTGNTLKISDVFRVSVL